MTINLFILFLVIAKLKQACFAHGLSKKVQVFTAVHNSIFKFSSEDTSLLFKP